MAVRYLGTNSPDGTCLGTASTVEKISFYGSTPVVQPTSASQAAVTSHTTTTATTTALESDVDALRVLTNQLRAELVSLGLITGS